jgi:hypothetical protein
MGRIIIVDIKPDIIPTITDSKYDNDIQGNIYEKMMKLSINNTSNELINNKPIKRDAIWFD